MPIQDYTFFIDESGKFRGNRCVIGGVLCKTAQSNPRVAGSIIERIRAPYLPKTDFYIHDHDPNRPNEEIRMDFRHAQQLPYSIKAKVKIEMLTAIRDAGYRMVVFQPERGFLVLDNSSETYLAFLAEGVVRVMQTLAKEGPFRLSLIVGERKDTGLMDHDEEKAKHPRDVPPISKARVSAAIRKQLTLARALEPNSFHGQAQLASINVQRDKSDLRLVLSDYVANSWYTQSSFQSSDALSAAFEDLSKSYIVLRMNNESLQASIQSAVRDNDLTRALFLAVTAPEDADHRDDFIKNLQDTFRRTSLVQLKSAMTEYHKKLEPLVNFRRECEQAIAIIDCTVKYFATPDVMRDYHAEFLANLLLWKMGACTHLGDIAAFRAAAEECDPAVRATQDINLYLAYITYLVVHDQSAMDYAKSLADGAEAIDVIHALRAPTKAIEERTGRTFFLYRERFAKLCGSLVSACIHVAGADPSILARGRALSDDAIASFQLPEDRDRQYQLRAELESICGEHDEAVRYLNKALHIDLAAPTGNRYDAFSPFEWYHFSKILAHLFASDEDRHRKLAASAFSAALPLWKSYRKALPRFGFPDIVTDTHMGICYAMSGNVKKGLELVEAAYTAAEPSATPTVAVIALMERAVALALAAMEHRLTAEDLEPLQLKVVERGSDWPFPAIPALLEHVCAELDKIATLPDAKEQQRALIHLSHLADF